MLKAVGTVCGVACGVAAGVWIFHHHMHAHSHESDEHKECCPYVLGFVIDNWFRSALLQPVSMFKNAGVLPGWKCIDLGCGHGVNSLAMAEVVGQTGKVYAIDIQPEMLAKVKERAASSGYGHIIETVQCTDESLCLPEGASGTIDIACLFWVLHEVPHPEAVLKRLYDALKPGGKLLFAEPAFHVTGGKFALETCMALDAGFRKPQQVDLTLTSCLVFEKPGAPAAVAAPAAAAAAASSASSVATASLVAAPL